MSYTEKITIKNPSRKLEEAVRKIGVQKYLWLEKLCSDETQPTHTVKIWWTRFLVIQGVAEPYYFHIIARQEHLVYADLIAEEHHKDFDK